jgi:hypothetical protein
MVRVNDQVQTRESPLLGSKAQHGHWTQRNAPKMRFACLRGVREEQLCFAMERCVVYSFFRLGVRCTASPLEVPLLKTFWAEQLSHADQYWASVSTCSDHGEFPGIRWVGRSTGLTFRPRNLPCKRKSRRILRQFGVIWTETIHLWRAGG